MNPMRSSHRDIEDFGSAPVKRETSSGPRLWNYVTAVLVIVVVVTIPILFVMVSNVKTDSKNYNMGSASAFTAAAGSSIAGGNAVSLSSTGVLQAGAGTSIYRSIVDLVTTCPKYLNMDAVTNNAYLISYSSAQTTSLQVVTVDSATPNKGTVVQTKTVQETIADMVTLSATTGLFVGIGQDQEANLSFDVIVAGTVNPTTYAISTLSQSGQYAGNYSVSPRITRLSDTEFAIAYYDQSPQKMFTRYGQVDPTTMHIVLSDPFEFYDDAAMSHNFDIVGLTSKSYALLFYNSTNRVDNWYGSGPLMGIYASVTGSTVSLSAVTTLLDDTAPVFSLASTRVSSTSAVVTFADYNHNFGINTQYIYVKNKLIAFGSSLLLSNAPSLGLVDGMMMDLDVALTSDDGEFMVLYSDASNNYAMTATTAQITSSREIERTSPDFLLTSGDASSTSKYSWGALAVGSSTPLAGRTGILSAVTDDSTCDGTVANAPVNFAMMDVLPGLFGTTAPTTTTTYSAGSAINVITSGVQNGWSSAGRAPLTTGAVYFTNSMGTIMKSSTFYGHEADSAAGYFYDTASDTIVTSTGRVGYAVSSDALVVEH